MLTPLRSNDRGYADHGWLKAFHSFSFADYYNPGQMGFRALRVINEDRIAPGRGFGMHGHRDMEIITYVLAGALEHKDSLGNGATLRPGELQRISAGTGVRHSEFNPSATTPVHLYQIWLLPRVESAVPRYEQRRWADDEKQGRLLLVASPDGVEGSFPIYQNARVYLASLEPGERVTHELAPGRHAWLQTLRGSIEVSNGSSPGAAAAGDSSLRLGASDAVAVSDERRLVVAGVEPAEVMLFDLE